MPDGKGRPYHPKDVPAWAWWGSTLFGLGLAWTGLKHIVSGEADASELGAISPAGGPMQSRLKGGVLRKATLLDVGSIDERLAVIRKLTLESSKRPEVKETAVKVLSRKCGSKWCIPEKDYLKEIEALFNYVRGHVRYVRDHARVDGYAMADKTLRLGAGDCFVRGTLVLRDSHELVPIESLRVGDRIWGLDRWSTVANVWEKGDLPTWRVGLNNGSAMRLTPGHHVPVYLCGHEHADGGARCAVPMAQRQMARMEVRNLRPGMVLGQPARIPFGAGDMDPDRALVEGLFLSDGSTKYDGHGRARTFDVAGKDGCPKEAQKRTVQAICERFKVATKWYSSRIVIKDRAWAERCASMGRYAPQKHALSIDLGEGPAGALLRGIMADSGKNTNGGGRTFTSTSRALWLQTRVLHKMFGISASERYIVDHGGLGENPIWRLGIRDPHRADGKPEKLLRVKSIVKDGAVLPCVDIATDDHMVWLPEADWTTLNCDDYSITLGALLLAVGYPIKFRVIQTKGAATWSHIYLLVGVPPQGPKKWIPLDASVNKPAGWEVSPAQVAKVKDFEV